MPVYLDPSKAYVESNLHFDPPHDRAFRLADSALADTLKRFGIHEMDFGWWDEPQQTMNLLEVKDYSEAQFNKDHCINECVQKATDCLLLLASAWYSLPYGARVRDCIPEEWSTIPVAPPRLHLFFVMKMRPPPDARSPQDPVGMDGLEVQARERIKGRLELFQVRQATTLFLMDHRMAATRGLPIKTREALLGELEPARPTRRRK